MSGALDMTVKINRLPSDFDRWDELLTLIKRAFAYMDGVVDPPSSAGRLTSASLAGKAAEEICLVALSGERPAGSVFAAERDQAFYVGKLAVDPGLQRTGIGRALLEAVESQAIRAGKPELELQTRVELAANHAAFARLGFVVVGRTAHPGFDRATSIIFRKRLS